MRFGLSPICIWLTALIVIAASADAASAQGSATLRGTVRASATGAVIQGARVTIARPNRSAISDAKGSFELRNLPTGQYDVTISAVGWEPAQLPVTLTGSDTSELDVRLLPGSIMLSQVVVTGTDAPTEAKKVAATVNVLTPQQVKSSPARETQDMLREIPGVEVPRTSSQVSRTEEEVGIRGVGEGRTVVLLDGIPLTDAWGEWTDWNRAPKNSIDHVEVVEGGGSDLYGNGALGGVIAFYSKPIAPGSYSAVVEGGSRDFRHTYLSAGVPIAGPFSASVSGDYAEGGGYQFIAGPSAGPVDRISSVITRNASARLDYAPSSDLSAFLTVHLFGDDRNLGTPLSKENRTDAALDMGINYGSFLGGTLTGRAWVRNMRENQFQTTIGSLDSIPRSVEHLTSWLHTPSYDRGVGVSWSRKNVLGFRSIGAGADYRYIRGYVDEQDYANTDGNEPTANSMYGGNQAMSGVYAGGVLAPTDRMLVDVGARVDMWQNGNGFSIDSSGPAHYPNATRSAFSPRLGVTYQFTTAFSAHVAAYHAFRAPILAQLYRRSVTATTVTLPNPALQPETATGYEVGGDWQPARWLQIKGTVYRADYHDFNAFVTTSAPGAAQTVRQRENVQSTRSVGGEAYLALRPVDHLSLIGSLSYDDARITDLGPLPSTATTYVGARVTQIPYQQGTVRLSYDARSYGEWTLINRYEGNAILSSGLTLPAFKVFDASVRRQITNEVNGFASVENLFGRRYDVNLSGLATAPVTSVGIPRTLRVGLEVDHY